MALWPAALGAQPIPLEDPFEGNGDFAGTQARPQVGVSDSEDFVITWDAAGATIGGAGQNTYFRKFLGIDGSALDLEAILEQATGFDDLTRLAVNGSGDFVVTWRRNSSNRDVALRSSTSNGTVLGAQSQANVDTVSDIPASDVCRWEDDTFVVVWDHDNPRFRLFGASGSPTTGELDVTTATTADRPVVGCLGGGGFVVVWEDDDADGSGIFARFFSSLGAAQGATFRVNELEDDNQVAPLVGAAADTGGFVVTWLDRRIDQAAERVELRLFTDAGLPLGGDRLVTETIGSVHLSLSDLDVAADGAFVIAATDNTESVKVWATEFHRTGEALPGGFTIPTDDVTAEQIDVGVGRLTYVLAWVETFITGDPNIIARRFLRRSVYADDFESGDLTPWGGSAPAP